MSGNGNMERAAEAEAVAFVRLVRYGELTCDEALDYLGVSAEVRAVLESLAATASPATSAAIRSVLLLRELALAEFVRMIGAPAARAA